MAQIHGSKATIWIDDQGGTCRNMTGDTTSITANFTKNNPDTTTLSHRAMQRIDGLRDLTIDVSAIFNTSASTTEVTGLLDQMWIGSLISRVQYLPAGSVTGCPIYTASMRLSNHSYNSPVDGVTVANFSLANAAGSPIAACAV